MKQGYMSSPGFIIATKSKEDGFYIYAFAEKQEEHKISKEFTKLSKEQVIKMAEDKKLKDTILSRDFVNGETPPNGYNPLHPLTKEGQKGWVKDQAKILIESLGLTPPPEKKEESVHKKDSFINNEQQNKHEERAKFLIQKYKNECLHDLYYTEDELINMLGITPSSSQVREWIKENEELFGFDQNTKLTILAFYGWIKSR
jgi:hypothetical protein